ncbi:MAG TPA: arsenate reductase ArsC [Aliidongia sp.]|nr:arsenate reductase ArsC [Aliidongia sp.]
MADHVWQVLFACSDNSARGIMAEALLTHWGRGRFHVVSAGYRPADEIDPIAKDLLGKLDLATGALHPKSWDRFAGPDAPALDFVFVLCESCAEQPMPEFPGHPMVAHWHLPDPKQAEGSEVERAQAFREALRSIEARIKPFVALREEALDRIVMRERLEEIGRRGAIGG